MIWLDEQFEALASQGHAGVLSSIVYFDRLVDRAGIIIGDSYGIHEVSSRHTPRC